MPSATSSETSASRTRATAPGTRTIARSALLPSLALDSADRSSSRCGFGRVERRVEARRQARWDNSAGDRRQRRRAEDADRPAREALTVVGLSLAEPAVEERGPDADAVRRELVRERVRPHEPGDVASVDPGVAGDELDVGLGQLGERKVAAVPGLPREQPDDDGHVALELRRARVGRRQFEVDLRLGGRVEERRRFGEG